MSTINWKRILLAGLAIGFFMNISEFILNGIILAKDVEQATKALNLAPPAGDFIAKAVGLTFIVGFVTVLLYAAIYPRFKESYKTILTTGLVVWFLIFVYGGVMDSAMGLFSWKITLIGITWGLVETQLGALFSSWLYREAE